MRNGQIVDAARSPPGDAVKTAQPPAKTNAARLLDTLGIPYELRPYEVDPDDLTAISVARKIGLPPSKSSKPSSPTPTPATTSSPSSPATPNSTSKN